MKKIVVVFTSLLLMIFAIPQVAKAHILKTDGNIGAVFHVDPDDDPIAGQQTGFFFEFKDKQRKFTPQNCNCTFSITEDGKQIFSQPLFQNNTDPSLTNASIFYAFPEKNVYQIKVIGKPNTPDAFQPFTLVYDVRVARETVPTGTQNTAQTTNENWFTLHLPHLIAGIIIGIFLLLAIVRQATKKKTA